MFDNKTGNSATKLWTIHYYNEKLQDTILAWPKKMVQRYLRIIDLIKIEGPDLGMPFTRSIGTGLFEIRVQAPEGIGRIFFCYASKKQIVVLHAFIKKTQKTPGKEWQIAKQRMKEIKNERL